MKDKLICKCGSNRFVYKYGVVLTSNPPINKSYYECYKCGEEHIIKIRGEFPKPQEIIIDEMSNIKFD